MDIVALQEHAKKIRRSVVESVYASKSGHTGGALSIVEILVALFDMTLTEKDIFILSKGHACLSYFKILEDKGYKPKRAGHPERDPENGILCTTGSLGHGLPQGIGMALAKKIKGEPGRVYILMSDGECQEGTTWESLLLASHYKLDNLVIIIDNNKLQTLGTIESILSLGNLNKKFEAFNLHVESINGHVFDELLQAFQKKVVSSPLAIIADTVKGKGISFMEGISGWHTMIPNEEQYKQALKELE